MTTCPGCKETRIELAQPTTEIIISETRINNIKTRVYNIDELDDIFFLVGLEVGEKIVFLVKYGGGGGEDLGAGPGGDIGGTGFGVELRISGGLRSISYQGKPVPLSSDPAIAVGEGNAVEVHKGLVEKISQERKI